MSSRRVIALGTASQAPTRSRAHNAFALRWDELLVLFDPGEGTQRQCILAGVAIARLDAVCITHFHGDHSLGLPGVIQRRALDARSADRDLAPLAVYFPAADRAYFDRLAAATIFHDTSRTVPVGVEGRSGSLVEVGRIGPDDDPSLILTVAPLRHRVATVGYRLAEPDGIEMLPDRLKARGIAGPDVGRLISEGRLETDEGTVGLAEVSRPRVGQSMAFIMDTAPCVEAVELARSCDLAVFESTFLHSERDLAEQYCHLTARQAAELAVEAGVRRLVLGHFSARYNDLGLFETEASAIHDDVVVVKDLDEVKVPSRR